MPEVPESQYAPSMDLKESIKITNKTSNKT